MKIALIGYGKMGKTIERIAKEKGHQISAIIDKDNADDIFSDNFKSSDVAVEFSTPETAVSNIKTCIESGVPVVCGTTGWLDKMEEIKALRDKVNGTVFYASNYSIGVNILFRLNEELARMIKAAGYNVSIEEIHHTQKLDAPSGTAISLAEGIISQNSQYKKWSLTENASDIIPIKAIRENDIPGTHTIEYRSTVDIIKLEHIAKSREGFASGAVAAAEYIVGKRGFFTMKDLLAI